MKTLSELSKHTLSKYFVKSVKDHDKLMDKKKKLGGKSTPEISARMNKRSAGLDRALPRLQHEETIEELDRSTVASYEKKADKDFYKQGDKADAGDKKAATKFKARKVGLDRAVSRLEKEETDMTQPLSELNKDTLYSYKKKSEKSLGDADKKVRGALDKVGASTNKADRNSHMDSALKAARTGEKRIKGMDRADARLEKEETEMTQPLTEARRLVSKHGKDGDVHTAKVYKDHDWDEYQVHFFKHGKHMGEGPVSYHGGDKKDAQHTADSALHHMNTAHAKSNPTNEEVEPLEELSKTTLSSYTKKAVGVAQAVQEAEEQLNELSPDTLNSYLKKRKKIINKQTRLGGKAKEKDVDNYRKAWGKRDMKEEVEAAIKDSIVATVEHAFNGDAAEMRDELYAAIQGKISQALEMKKQELANSLVAGSITKEE